MATTRVTSGSGTTGAKKKQDELAQSLSKLLNGNITPATPDGPIPEDPTVSPRRDVIAPDLTNALIEEDGKLMTLPEHDAYLRRQQPSAPTNDVLAQINQQVADREAQINQQFAASDRRFYEEARTAAEKMRQQPSAQQTTAQQSNPQLQALLDQMLGQVNAIPDYTARTLEERRAIAEGEYNPYYEQMRLTAQQAADRNTLALQQQKEGLQDTYDKQRAASQEAYDQAYSQADRQMLSRGMQRSSYGAQTLANISAQGNKAQQELWDAQGAAEGNIDAQITQLANQLSDTLQQYDASEAQQILSRIRELEDQDYERGANAAQQKNQLLNQIYQNIYQAERDGKLDEQTAKQLELQLAQFEEGKRQFGVTSGQNQQKIDIDRRNVEGNLELAQQQLERQQQRDAVSDQQWQQQFAYQQGRDDVSDQQWKQQLEYQQGRDAVSDQQWKQQFERQGQRDAVSDQQWQQQFERQGQRDTVSDQQFNESMQFQREQAQTAQARAEQEIAYKTATAILAGGKVPSASLLEQAGIDAEDAQMLADIYAAGAKGSSSGSSGSRTSSTAGTGNTNQTPQPSANDLENSLIGSMGGDYGTTNKAEADDLFARMGALIGGVVNKTSDVVEKLQDGTFANALTNALDPTNPANKQKADNLLEGLRKNKVFQTALNKALGYGGTTTNNAKTTKNINLAR